MSHLPCAVLGPGLITPAAEAAGSPMTSCDRIRLSLLC